MSALPMSSVGDAVAGAGADAEEAVGLARGVEADLRRLARRHQAVVAVVAEAGVGVHRPGLLLRGGDGRGAAAGDELLGDLRRLRVGRTGLYLLQQRASLAALAVAQQRHRLVVLAGLAQRRILLRLAQVRDRAGRIAQPEVRDAEVERRREAAVRLLVGALEPLLRGRVLAAVEIEDAEVEQRRLEGRIERQGVFDVADRVGGVAEAGLGQAAVVGGDGVIGIRQQRLVEDLLRFLPTLRLEGHQRLGVQLLRTRVGDRRCGDAHRQHGHANGPPVSHTPPHGCRTQPALHTGASPARPRARLAVYAAPREPVKRKGGARGTPARLTARSSRYDRKRSCPTVRPPPSSSRWNACGARSRRTTSATTSTTRRRSATPSTTPSSASWSSWRRKYPSLASHDLADAACRHRAGRAVRAGAPRRADAVARQRDVGGGIPRVRRPGPADAAPRRADRLRRRAEARRPGGRGGVRRRHPQRRLDPRRRRHRRGRHRQRQDDPLACRCACAALARRRRPRASRCAAR